MSMPSTPSFLKFSQSCTTSRPVFVPTSVHKILLTFTWNAASPRAWPRFTARTTSLKAENKYEGHCTLQILYDALIQRKRGSCNPKFSVNAESYCAALIYSVLWFLSPDTDIYFYIMCTVLNSYAIYIQLEIKSHI